MTDEEKEIIKEYKPCFGEYYDEKGNVCRDGNNGFCAYCRSCQRECIYY